MMPFGPFVASQGFWHEHLSLCDERAREIRADENNPGRKPEAAGYGEFQALQDPCDIAVSLSVREQKLAVAVAN